jgi:hypothetical protein
MPGFRSTRVLIKCFVCVMLIVEHFPRFVSGIACLVALFMAFSQKHPPEVTIHLFHDCLLSSVVGRFCTLGAERLLRKEESELTYLKVRTYRRR